MPTVNKNIDFNFFNRSGRVPPKVRFNVWGSACGLSVDAYNAIGRPEGLRVGIDTSAREIHVYPVLEKNNEAAIYPPKAALQKSKIIISRARVVLKELTELGITKNISGEVIIEGDSKKLIFKF